MTIKKSLLNTINCCRNIFYRQYNPGCFNQQDIKNVLIIRTDRIGDLVLSLPAIRELKRGRPEIKITMLVTDYTKELLGDSKIVDFTITVKQNLSFWEWAFFIMELRKVKYDLAIDMLFSRKLASAIFVFLSNSKIKLGYNTGIKSLLFNCRVDPGNIQQYEVERNFEPLKHLVDLKTVNKSLSLGCITPDFEYLNKLYANKVINKNGRLLIAIHPGAYKNVKNRVWPKEYYAQLADKIIDKYGAMVFFTGSQANGDRVLLRNISNTMKNKAFFVTEEVNLRQIYALYEISDVFIGSFSGPLHLAAAAGAFTIVLGGPTPVKRWMPVGMKHTIVQADLLCVPCNDSVTCKRGDYACMRNIKVNDVFLALEKAVEAKKEKINVG